MKKYILLTVFLFLLSTPAYAKSALTDERVRNLANDTMVAIYEDILEIKDTKRELRFFDEDSIGLGENGVYAIEYNYGKSKSRLYASPFEFAVTITDADDSTFDQYGPYAFNLVFPVLKLKFTGYQKINYKRYQFDVLQSVVKQGERLTDLQQTRLPLQLVLRTEKEVFNIGEPIVFEIELQNVSNANYWVKPLTAQSLYCILGHKRWGNPNPIKKRKGEFVLKSGESVKAAFSGYAFRRPKDFEMKCIYNTPIKGIQPEAKLKIKVE